MSMTKVFEMLYCCTHITDYSRRHGFGHGLMASTINMRSIKDIVTKHLLLQIQFYDDNY